MDFSVSERTQTAIEMIREFLVEEVLPLEFRFLQAPFAELVPALEEKRQKVRQMGLWAPQHPAALGGMGLGLVDFALVSEALGVTPLGHYVFGAQAPDAGNIEILHRHGSAEQQERWLGPLVAGELRSCFSMTEPEMPGSNPVMLETSAVTDGGEWVINGQKWYTTAADGAALAVVMAVTEPEAEPHRRASMILVPTDTPGFERVRNLRVMGDVGDGFFSHSEILYRDCRVPLANLLGGRGDGFVIAQERLGPGRIHHCMRWLGICRRALDLACARAADRTVAPGRKLADKEIVQAWLAESSAAVEAARALTLQTAWQIEQSGWKECREAVSMIKFHVAGVLQEVLDRALQIHGGLGMTDDTVLAFLFRHERAARIYDGPDEVHKLAVARRLLRRYRHHD